MDSGMTYYVSSGTLNYVQPLKQDYEHRNSRRRDPDNGRQHCAVMMIMLMTTLITII